MSREPRNTRTMPVARVNRVITVELTAEILRAPHGPAAFLFFELLVWRRFQGDESWMTIPNTSWTQRTEMIRQSKYRGAQTLEEMGLIVSRKESGGASTEYRLVARVDPRSGIKRRTAPTPPIAITDADKNVVEQIFENHAKTLKLVT